MKKIVIALIKYAIFFVICYECFDTTIKIIGNPLDVTLKEMQDDEGAPLVEQNKYETETFLGTKNQL